MSSATPRGTSRPVSDDDVPMTLWNERPVPEAVSSVQLAAMIEREAELSAERLLTVTPKSELDDIGRSQQLLDQAFVQQVRVIVAAHDRAADQEFVADEVALALGVSVRTAKGIVRTALGLARLPGMLEAVGAGMLSQRHALAVLRTLDDVPDLTAEQRACITTIVLMRLDGTQTPGDLARVTERLILTVDLAAAEKRREAATRKRCVRIYPAPDGQAVFTATGPLERIALIRSALHAWRQDNPRDPEDTRSEAEREFDLVLALLTGGEKAARSTSYVVVPFSVADGHDLELAEVPGLGPVLPSVARQLLEDSEMCAQIAVDEAGAVIAVTDPRPLPVPARQKAGEDVQPSERLQSGEEVRHPAWPGGPGSTGGWPDTCPWDEPEPEPVYWPPAEPMRLNDPPNPAPAPRAPVDEEWRRRVRDLLVTPPPERLRPENLASDAYRAPVRLKRFLRARDRHCVFPGCTTQVVDIDHRIPYPQGPTDATNTQQLCRRHHRAKQKVFTVRVLHNGDYVWATRGGWAFVRRRITY